ncbi:MAG: putative lipid II flippase FtsW [Patescibacteria group bacterium]|nr:putative lipid II flippase FtsW [Patescibacteria group bacterium]MDD5715100.1 putative lipid II flippase FtsW [Patescibacteria group bacterium]
MIRIHKPDYTLLITCAILAIYGLVMLASASSVLSFEKFGDSNYFLKHQLIYGVGFGLVGFFLAYKLDYHRWKKFAFAFLAINILLLLAVFIPGIGYAYGGARRWIQLGPSLFQPTEILKLTFILYLSTLFAKNIEGIKDPAYGLVPLLVILGSIVFLIMLQPDMGTMVTIAATGLIVFFTAGAPLKQLAGIFGSAVVLFFILIKLAPYRAARFTIFLNPALDPQGIGYHINQALMAIGSGGILGLGLGHSRQKFLYLPEVTGDSIFAIVAEELGLVFAIILILLFLTIMFRGFKIAAHAPDTYGRLLAIGITTWIVLQAFINIAAMVTLVPLTGIPLPFVSYGSSALVTIFFSIGILSNISKQTKT